MNESFTVIIPTMWLSEYIKTMVGVYARSPFVKEIIIIDNAPKNTVNFPYEKVKKHTKGHNIYVNPAWNLGASLAESENLLIANDDILINEHDFNNLIEKSIDFLHDNVIIGPSEYNFKTPTLPKQPLVFERFTKNFTYGFGTFMLMKRTSYTIIPEDILIFHGDVILFKTNTVYLFTGVYIDTPMSITLKSKENPELHGLAKLDFSKARGIDYDKLKKIK